MQLAVKTSQSSDMMGFPAAAIEYRTRLQGSSAHEWRLSVERGGASLLPCCMLDAAMMDNREVQ